MKNFIRTSDENVAQKLRSSGFTEMGKQGDMYCFINNGKLTFSEEEKEKINYTNVLAV